MPQILQLTLIGIMLMLVQGSQIETRAELNAAIEAGPNRKMGFLSDANYKSVHTVLSKKVEPVIFTSTSDLYEAVDSGTVLAGLISGVPDKKYVRFSTDLISPRGFHMKQGEDSRDLMEAIDAAVVRAQNAGDVQSAEKANPPFEAVEVHTCRADDPQKVPFPSASKATGLLKDVLDTGKLRMLAYGTPDALPDWHQDGDYTADPPTGFWPDYVTSFMRHFRGAYGNIALERVWMKAGGVDSVLNGSIHLTSPYYIIENFYNDRVKKWSHVFSCVVVGYEQQFFAKRTGATVITDSDGSGSTDSCTSKLNTCVGSRLTNQISDRSKLNEVIDAGPNRKMGFLSEANYKSVHTTLSKKVVPTYFTSTTELYKAVEDGTVLAALISGVPDTKFHRFTTDVVSPRAFQMMPGSESRDLMEAVDAAVVRSHNAGDLLRAEQRNPPFEAVEIHTCRADDLDKVPFPEADKATGLLKDVLDTRTLRILAFGTPDDKPDWHQDGNYKVDPPTGFWPDYMESFMTHFRLKYGSDIKLERVWMKAGGTASVLNGSIHMSEPYYIYESIYNDRMKKWSHEYSCVVMGYEQQFFALRAETDFSSAGATCESQLAACEARCSDPDTVHGGTDSRTMFASSSVNAPANCVSENQTRTCNNKKFGSWSGTYTSPSCDVKARCSSPDTAHGGRDRRTMYQSATVDAPAACTSETQTRTCNDGTFGSWTGTYAHTSCSVNGQARCTNPDTVHDGTDTRTMYQSATVDAPAACTSETQTRTCNDGTFGSWTGTYGYNSCSNGQSPAPGTVTTELSEPVLSGATEVKLKDVSGLQTGMQLTLADGTNTETKTISNVQRLRRLARDQEFRDFRRLATPGTVTLDSALQFGYAAHVQVTATPAPGVDTETADIASGKAPALLLLLFCIVGPPW